MADLKPPLAGLALWLEPSGNEYHVFDALLQMLVDYYQGSKFVPHVTLLSLLDWPPERAEGAQDLLAELAERSQPFTLEFTGIGRREMFFQSVFLQAVPTVELLSLRALACALYRKPDDPYMPHASLFYGDLPAAQKNKMLADIGSDFPAQQRVTNVSLIAAKGYPHEWVTIARFPLTGS